MDIDSFLQSNAVPEMIGFSVIKGNCVFVMEESLSSKFALYKKIVNVCLIQSVDYTIKF